MILIFYTEVSAVKLIWRYSWNVKKMKGFWEKLYQGPKKRQITLPRNGHLWLSTTEHWKLYEWSELPDSAKELELCILGSHLVKGHRSNTVSICMNLHILYELCGYYRTSEERMALALTYKWNMLESSKRKLEMEKGVRNHHSHCLS